MNYAYTAKSNQGETSTGQLTADSPAQVYQLLREKGLFPVSVKAAGQSRSVGGIRPAGRRRGVSRKDLVGLTSQLAIMTRAGIDVAGALESLARQAASPVLRSTLTRVHTEVMGGKSFSQALKSQAEVFGQGYVASVAAGEASGRLPEVLDRLARMQRAELRLRGTLRGLLAYPLVLSVVSGLVILGLVFFVLPQFSGVFDQFDMPLPAVTRALLGVSSSLREWWWLWGLFVAAAAAGGWRLRTSPGGRRWCDHFVLHAALIREVTRALLIGRTFRLLGIMIDSGVPLLEALRLTRSSLRNSLYRELFDRLESDVLNGRGLTGALAVTSFIPASAVEMIATAERTGTLGMVTQVMGDFYEEEGESGLRELATLIEPAIIVTMGVVVALVVMAVMLPIFDFATIGNG